MASLLAGACGVDGSGICFGSCPGFGPSALTFHEACSGSREHCHGHHAVSCYELVWSL